MSFSEVKMIKAIGYIRVSTDEQAKEGLSLINLIKHVNEFMIGFGKRILFDFPSRNPSEIDRTVEFNFAGHISAGEYLHKNFKVGVGMFDLCHMPGNLHVQIHFFLDFSDTGPFSVFMFSDFAARKFP